MATSRSFSVNRRGFLGAAAAISALALTGCVQGEKADDSVAGGNSSTLNIDFATYNPLSLVIKKKGWLEATLAPKNVKVNWLQSAGSNKANEALRSGAVDVGSTAGSAALLARSNGSPIKTISIFSQPEWAALVTGKDSKITKVSELKGKNVAATKGTDPYFFLVQSLAEAGLKTSDVTVQNLQHADGRAALDNGSVDAWAGLDPIMAAAEHGGDKLFYRNLSFNTYGFLNATEAFLKKSPEVAQVVVDAYEKARAWAVANPKETAQILADAASLDLAVATTVIVDRSNLGVSGIPGAKQKEVLTKIGPTFVSLGDVDSQEKVDNALNSLLDDSLAKKADASAIKES